MSYEIHNADVVEWATSYDGPPFHALLCDPPYELGFMGKKWDGGGVSFRPETWAALAEHLYPGAFGMAFASSRGWHRMACAIEDAGLRFHPSVFMYGWNFGSGFPKSTRVGKNGDHPEFDEHRYGGQVLKPSLEPIIVFQKPYDGKPVECITETGAGALWVDGGRIGVNGNDPNHRRATGDNGGADSVFGVGNHKRPATLGSGRWPANFVLVHSPECDDDGCSESCPVRLLGEQSGELAGGGKSTKPTGHNGPIYGKYNPCQISIHHPKGGTAARFFYQSDWSYEVAEQITAADPVRYVAKAGRRERDAGLEGMPTRANVSENYGTKRVNLTRKDLGENRVLPVRNPHPTVKPIALIRYLATLLLPPAMYAPRRIIIPFAGVMSEAIGAGLAGWEEIVAIEGEAEYCELGKARLRYWLMQPALPWEVS